MLSQKPNLVFLVAHPDDLSHSMGGTAYLLREKYNLHVLCLTKGEYGIKSKTPSEAAAIRELEETKACEILEAKLTFLGQIDAYTYADASICEKVSKILNDLKPKAVFTLWPINEHPDHIMVYNITIKSLQLAGLYKTTEIYCSENAIGLQTNQFHPDIYVDITSVINIKRQLIECHYSQNPTIADVEKYIQRTIFRGQVAGCANAEGFKTNYPITVNGPRKVGSVLFSLYNG